MKDYSQYGEQEHIFKVFDTLGITKGHLVDLGASDGYTMSNSRALLERGWTGDLYDGDPKGAKDVTKAWITTENPPCLQTDTEFITIDLDGNDYHILENILGCTFKASLIVSEINPIFERNEAKVMPYKEAHVWNNDTYYGASLAAFEKMVIPYGYTLMYLHHSLNAFFLRNDHAAAHPELIRKIEYKQKWNHARHNPELPWISL